MTGSNESQSIGQGVWTRIGEQLGSGALRPRISERVRVVHIDHNLSLVDRETGRRLDLDDAESRWVGAFDGKRTVSELIVEDMRITGVFAMQPMLDLVDKLLRSGMLAGVATNVYRELDRRFRGPHPDPLEQAPLATDTEVEPVDDHAQFERSVEELRPRLEAERAETADVAARDTAADPGVPLSHPQRSGHTPHLVEREAFLASINLFAGFDHDLIGMLARIAEERAFPATAVIVSEGEPSDLFYIVKSGDAVVTKRDGASGTPHRIAQVGRGGYFGELGLLNHTVRSATVKAGTLVPVVTYSFQSPVFEDVIRPHVAEWNGHELISHRRRQMEHLQLFAHLDSEALNRAARVLSEELIDRGEDVVREGESGDRFYVIVEGEMHVLRGGSDAPVTLGPGDFFGETALLFDRPRSATVRAARPSRVLSLSKDDFEQLMRRSLLAERTIMPTVLNRL